ncbi:hypothetical protein ABNM83_18275 [Pseudomonas syringae]|nr:hypothetical protein PviCFBP13507_23430 [Pseudomonas viridiflava]
MNIAASHGIWSFQAFHLKPPDVLASYKTSDSAAQIADLLLQGQQRTTRPPFSRQAINAT